MGLLYLVGTCHTDLKGPERLIKFFDIVKPSYICLEACEQTMPAVQKLKERRQWLKQNPRKKSLFERVRSFFKGPDLRTEIMNNFRYELVTASEYKDSHPNIEVFGVEDLEAHKKAQKEEEEKYKKTGKKYNDATVMEDLLDYLNKTFSKYEHKVYFLTDFFYEDDFMSGGSLDIQIERDEKFEKNLREIHKTRAEKTGVFIAGAAHFFHDYGSNVYERLKDLNPVRIKLNEVDKQ